MPEKQESTDLVVADQMAPEQIHQQLEAWGFGGLSIGYITSLSATKPEDRKLAFEMLSGSGNSFDTVVNQELLCRDVFISPAILTDTKTGEVIKTLVTRMITPEGLWYSTHSQTFFKAVVTYQAMVRKAPWNPPLKYKVERRKTTAGFHFFAFVPMDDSPLLRPGKNK